MATLVDFSLSTRLISQVRNVASVLVAGSDLWAAPADGLGLWPLDRLNEKHSVALQNIDAWQCGDRGWITPEETDRYPPITRHNSSLRGQWDAPKHVAGVRWPEGASA